MQIESSARLNRNDIISPMRQAWIDTLRTKLSEFLSLSSIYHRFLSSDENILQFQKEHNIQPVPPDIERKLFILYLNIVLMLNDNESDHNRLIDLLGNFRVDLFDDDVPSEDKRKSYQEIIRLSKSILKREWERVKKDE